MFEDRALVFLPRAVDDTWRWQGLTRPPAATGFRPFYGEVLHASVGTVSKWLARPHADARDLNEEDVLVQDVLFMAHDYLHAWAYGHVRAWGAPVSPGYTRITERNIEQLAFLHILTEACATVGLDYWYLATVNLNDVCDIGTTVQGLTTNFHESRSPEYRKYFRALDVQRPEFCEQLTRSYCSGVWPGVDRDALTRSPTTARWLRHELAYAKKQRRYIRHWLRHLGNLPSVDDDRLDAPLAHEAPWQKALTHALAHRLFAKVKDDKVDPPPRAPRTGRWRGPTTSSIDFRFTNIAALDHDEVLREAGRLGPGQFAPFASQFVAQHRFNGVSANRLPLLELALREQNAAALIAFMDGSARLPAVREPRDVFFVA